MLTGVDFVCDNQALLGKWSAALSGLQANVVCVHGYDQPVLIEGGGYPGIWLECGPLEGAVYGIINPKVALDNHRIFFRQQRDDGYLPCWIWADRAGHGQIQMVVPIAATAWEVFQRCGDRGFLQQAYDACQRWDRWLTRYRDTLGTGLCEAFCEYDTGHDNSPRFHGLPLEGRDGDARWCPAAGRLPYVAPDLSATVFGGRLALAEMARALGREEEAAGWTVQARQTRQLLLKVCYDLESACFYDRNRDGELVKIRGDALTRVLSEHVVDTGLFERIYRQQIRHADRFWTPFPLPSIAADDPAFVRELSPNSWGGASQALTALRAPRWFGHYGRRADLTHLMRQWIAALVADDGFRQQMNPWTGKFTPGPATYSPAMLVLIDFVRRLCGPETTPVGIAWNCTRLPDMGTARLQVGDMAIHYETDRAVLSMGDNQVAEVCGQCRVLTDARGRLTGVVGIAPEPQEILIRLQQGSVLAANLLPDQELLL